MSLNNNDALLYGTRSFFGVNGTDLLLLQNVTTTTVDSFIGRRESRDYRDIQLNDNNNAVAFTFFTDPVASVGEVILINLNGTTETIAISVISPDPRGFTDIGDVAINNQNTIAYSASDSSGTSIYTTSDRVIPIEGVGSSNIAINDSEIIVFGSRSGDREQLQQISASNEVTSLGNTDGLFNDFETVALNNQGHIAFKATLDDGTRGIFSRVDPDGDRLVAVGDSLSGSQVVGLDFSVEGLNNSGTITFQSVAMMERIP